MSAIDYLKNPYRIFYKFNYKRISRIIPDKPFLKLMFHARVGKRLNIKNPKTFNEKLQWLKLYDRNPEYTKLVDKYEVREFVSERVGSEYLVPLYGVWNSVDDIDFDSLPNEFVLKCTHDNGSTIICRDKKAFDIEIAKNKLDKAMKQNFYYRNREWPYKNVRPRVIAEKLLGDTELVDYKMMVFSGSFICSFTCENRGSESGMIVTFYDKEWRKLPFERKYPSNKHETSPPKTYNLMIELAETISKGLPFSRIDFYEVDGSVYFGEVTLHPGAGFEPFYPESWDIVLGNHLELPNN